MTVLTQIEQGKIGNTLALERSTVSRNIKLLERKGLLTKTMAYKPKIELSNKGKKLVVALIPGWEKVMDDLTGKIGSDSILLIQEIEKKLT